VAFWRDPYSIRASVSRRRVEVLRAGRVVRAFTVAVGAPGHDTPLGRFAVTDRLRVAAGSPYGCCALALSGHQVHLPPNWPGGDRLAIHATTDLNRIGMPVSMGCMRTTPVNARWLIDHVPLGTQVQIHA
jgi:lipoprotein-anchoring transpeptidase ErfK/SrfK